MPDLAVQSGHLAGMSLERGELALECRPAQPKAYRQLVERRDPAQARVLDDAEDGERRRELVGP